jgi:hypothetical protein
MTVGLHLGDFNLGCATYLYLNRSLFQTQQINVITGVILWYDPRIGKRVWNLVLEVWKFVRSISANTQIIAFKHAHHIRSLCQSLPSKTRIVLHQLVFKDSHCTMSAHQSWYSETDFALHKSSSATRHTYNTRKISKLPKTTNVQLKFNYLPWI